MGKPAIIYAPTPDAAPDAELDALASIYRLVLDCGGVRRAAEMKKAARPGSPVDAYGTRIAKGGAM